MMRILAGLCLVALLASCGADGMPTVPEPREDEVPEDSVQDEDAVVETLPAA